MLFCKIVLLFYHHLAQCWQHTFYLATFYLIIIEVYVVEQFIAKRFGHVATITTGNKSYCRLPAGIFVVTECATHKDIGQHIVKDIAIMKQVVEVRG